MIRTMLSGLAAVAVLATLAHAPAHAGKFKRSGASNMNNTGGASATTGNGAAASHTHNQKLRGGQNQPPANTGASIHALGVYLQWRERCLNNLLPRCE